MRLGFYPKLAVDGNATIAAIAMNHIDEIKEQKSLIQTIKDKKQLSTHPALLSCFILIISYQLSYIKLCCILSSTGRK